MSRPKDPDGHKQNFDALQKILKRMDVPVGRKTDYRWLARNLAINNSKHSDIQEALILISILMDTE